MQRPQHDAIEVAHLEPFVEAGLFVDLVKHLEASRRQDAALADALEQSRLSVLEREAVIGESYARRIVPTEHGSGQRDIEVVTETSAEPLEATLKTDRAQFLGYPAVECRVGQGVWRFPTGQAILERDGRIEGAPLQAH